MSIATATFQTKPTQTDIDHNNHVNNSVYLNWLQYGVTKHWKDNTTKDIQQEYCWIAARHEISYKAPAYLGDQIHVELVLTRLAGARAVYDAIIKRGADILAVASSTWGALHPETKRPRRLSSDVRNAFLKKAVSQANS